MTPEEQKFTNLVMGKLLSVWKEETSCPVCGTHQWTLSPTLWQLTEYRAAFVPPLGSGGAVPLVSMTCNTCGYTLLFNAISLGLVDKKTGEVARG